MKVTLEAHHVQGVNTTMHRFLRVIFFPCHAGIVQEVSTGDKRQEEDEHLIILCSDGVWDMVNPREAVPWAVETMRGLEGVALAQRKLQEPGRVPSVP